MPRSSSSSRLGRAIAVLVTLLVVAAVAVVVLVVVNVRDGGEDPAAERPAPEEPATLADVAAAGPLVVPREPFCDAVDPAAVQAALGGEVASAEAWANGDRVTLAPGVSDVAHENGCAWTGADGTVARAWVFAPPVTRGRARRLGAVATRTEGCAPYDAGGFGDPGVAFACASPEQAVAGHGALFGDAWLSCTVTAPAAPGIDLQERADGWCAAAALGAGA